MDMARYEWHLKNTSNINYLVYCCFAAANIKRCAGTNFSTELGSQRSSQKVLLDWEWRADCDAHGESTTDTESAFSGRNELEY